MRQDDRSIDLLVIEKVQRDFMRLIKDMGLLTYKDRLGQLKITTLLERRMRSDLRPSRF
jgi:hypothetical protein